MTGWVIAQVTSGNEVRLVGSAMARAMRDAGETPPGCWPEEAIARDLARAGFHVWFPMKTEMITRRFGAMRRKRAAQPVKVPLFRGLLMIRVEDAAGLIRAGSHPKVRDFFRRDGRAVIASDALVSEMRDCEARVAVPDEMPESPVLPEIGEQVRVILGPLDGFEAPVSALRDGEARLDLVNGAVIWVAVNKLTTVAA